ncbi:hypothetical protein AB0F91_41615 [Amycolatopsis sp. NPDC023774]|uniref:hypothetical protein n=1 Tax=Amycolatopsis sp. NPDC023774 TaxID=3155015 RepID=UPI0033C33E7B
MHQSRWPARPRNVAVDTVASRLVDLLVLDKCHFTFAFLFDVSAAIQYENMTRRGNFWHRTCAGWLSCSCSAW